MSVKRANGEGTIRKRDNGSWEGRITIGTERKSVYGRTKHEVVAKLNQLKAERAFGIYVRDTGLTVAAWLEIWLRDYCLSIKPTTRGKYASEVRLHLVPALGTIHLTKLTGPIIQKLYNQKQQEGMSPKTVRNLHGTLHKALSQAVKVHLLMVNPADTCEIPRGDKPVIKPIQDEDLGRFLNEIQHCKHYALFYVSLFTGLRKSEALGLTWDCIDFDRGTIRVYRQFSRNLTISGSPYAFTSLKNGKERTFCPAASVMTMLRQVQREQLEHRLQCGAAWENIHDLVFTSETGRHLDGNSVYRCFKRVVKKLGLDETRLHDLRHTFATLSIQNGTDIKTVSEMLGHATTAFTMDVYGHVTNTMQQDASRRMEHFIQGIQ